MRLSHEKEFLEKEQEEAKKIKNILLTSWFWITIQFLLI